jgi:hypothetical protein
MNYNLNNPIGIDKEVQKIQNYLHGSLVESWGDIDAYGRVYKNRKQLGFIPEVYKGRNEYLDAFYDDSENAKGIMFFLENHDHQSADGVVFKTRIKICFMLNLDEIGYDDDERADVVVQEKVVSILNKSAINNFTITGLEKTVRNVFYGYTYTDVELETDMHPLHTFAIIGDLEYYLTEKCN